MKGRYSLFNTLLERFINGSNMYPLLRAACKCSFAKVSSFFGVVAFLRPVYVLCVMCCFGVAFALYSLCAPTVIFLSFKLGKHLYF